MKFVIGIQARSGSSRLPGKCLMDLHGFPLWYWSYHTCKKTKIDTYMLLESTDSKMITSCRSRIKDSEICYNDSPLDRYKTLQEVTNCDYVIRVTADCPLVNQFIILDMKNIVEKKGLKFIYNEIDGMDVQIFHKSILKRPLLLSDEHVINMSAIKTADLYDKYEMSLSVDTQEDFDNIKEISKFIY